MESGQSLSRLTSKLLLKFEEYFSHLKPDLVLAHGDTTTSFSTALSCFYHQIPFFHVEAGLRTNRLSSPFPEEFNRRSIAPIASHHFAPTEREKENLLRDGISSHSITVTGSTVHDSVRFFQSISREVENDFPGFNFGSRPIVLVTLHRRESATSLQFILQGIRNAAASRSDAIFVCPVHPSPNVQRAFRACLGEQKNVALLPAMEYPRFLSILMKASLVVTDSGGVQEEAAFLGKRVLLARSETERSDGLDSGLVKIIGMNEHDLRTAILRELSCLALNTTNELTKSQPSASKLIAEKVLFSINSFPIGRVG